MKSGLDPWSQIEKFKRVADALLAREDGIVSALTTIETRKTAYVEFEKTVRALRTYAKEVPYIRGREPIGTVAVFLPFNNPLYSLVLYTFGSLLVGNRVLVKPSSLVTDISQFFFDTVKNAVPELDLEFNPSSGREFLARCLQREDIDVLVFTGSWENAERILSAIPADAVFIYCGSGMNPFIAQGDTDIEQAVECAIRSKLFNSGQDCLVPERFYIDAHVYDAFVSSLIARLLATRVGPNHSPDTDVGPLAMENIVKNVERLLAAPNIRSVVLSGEVRNRLMPPIVVEAEADAPIVTEEKYAPVFPLVKVGAEEEVIRLVNSLPYGLGATIYGQGSEHLLASLEVAHIAHNCSLLEIEDTDAHMPFGGYKRSGFVCQNAARKYGPILFSVETSVQIS